MTAELSERINELLRDELVILAEAEDGSSVPHATRPLSDAEQASGVRFGEIQAAQDDYMDAVTPALVALMGVTGGLVVAEAARVAMSATMLNTLDRWRVAPPAQIAEATDKAATVVERALVESFETSAQLVVKEAATQGVRIQPATITPTATAPLPEPAQATRKAVTTMAHTVANDAVDKVIDVTKQVYAAPTAVMEPPPPSVVEEILDDISHKGPLDVARQANNAVLGEARFATVEANERQPAWCHASELLDGRTCGPCSRIDGTEWDTLAEARKFYPPMSGYVECQGGSRCRGTCVFVYEDDDAEAEWDAS